MLVQDRALEAHHEAIAPRGPRVRPRVPDTQRLTGCREFPVELRAAVREPALQWPGRPSVEGHQDPGWEGQGLLGRERWQAPGDAVRGDRVARRDMPDLADDLEIADVERVEAHQVAGLLGVDDQVEWIGSTNGMVTQAFIDAALAIAAGLCSHVLVYRALHVPRGRYASFESARAGGPGSGSRNEGGDGATMAGESAGDPQ